MRRLLDLGVALLIVAGVMLAFEDALLAMLHQWQVNPMYSYAYSVPAISLFLLWARRDAFYKRSLRPARLAGGAVLVLSLGLLAVGQVGAIQVLQQFAFLVALVGVVLFLFGFDYLAVSAPALAYLLLMVPIWDVFTERLHWPFQSNSARFGVALMHAIGVPAYREGTVITLPNLSIEVARQCSGVNYLVAVLALALPLAYLRLRGVWRRVALILSAMLIAAGANSLRVALIGALAYYEVGSPLHGPFHVLHGLFVAGVGYVALFMGLRFLQSGAANAQEQTADAPISAAPRGRWSTTEAFALAVLFLMVWKVGIVPSSTPVALAAPLDTLATRLGPWYADPIGVRSTTPLPAAWNNADAHLSRLYRSQSGQTVTVDVWYFAVQKQNREVVSFRTAQLHRAAVPVHVPLHSGGVLDANLLRWPERAEAALFWYDIGGVPESHQNGARLRSLWNGLAARHSSGAAIMLRTPSPDGAQDKAVAALQAFAAELYPALVLHWAGRAHSSAGPS